MSTDPQTIRAEPHTEIGFVIQRDSDLLIERWTRRALQEQPNAARIHLPVLLDHFREFLLALGQSLTETAETETSEHCFHATVQRWDVGWSLPELVRDYRSGRLCANTTAVPDVSLIETALAGGTVAREIISAGLSEHGTRAACSALEFTKGCV